jgi:hypothetical protein
MLVLLGAIMSKNATLFLIVVLVLSSLLMVGSVSAESISKPSVPEFTTKYAVHFYDVAPIYEIDEFTGEQVIKEKGYRVDNTSVIFKIRNQPFTPYIDSTGNNISLYYNFRFKGHFGDEWKYHPFSETGVTTTRYVMFMSPPKKCNGFVASTSEYTDLSFRLTTLFDFQSIKSGDQIDFQVQAQTGYIDYFGDGYYIFIGQSSDWSETQAIKIAETQPEPTLISDSDFILYIGIVLLIIVVVFAILLFYFKKRKH